MYCIFFILAILFGVGKHPYNYSYQGGYNGKAKNGIECASDDHDGSAYKFDDNCYQADGSQCSEDYKCKLHYISSYYIFGPSFERTCSKYSGNSDSKCIFSPLLGWMKTSSLAWRH